MLEHIPEVGKLFLKTFDEHLESILDDVLVLVDVLFVEALEHMQPLHDFSILNDGAVLLVVVLAGIADEGVGDDAACSNANPLALVLTVEAQWLVMH